MKLSPALLLLPATLSAAVPTNTKRETAAAGQATLSYDPSYDDGSRDLTTTSCSDGDNGLIKAGFSTLSSLPIFPNVGGAFTVEGWNSPSCGNCYQLMFETNSIFVLAVDHTDDGFNIAKQAMDTLTNGRAEELGRVSVAWTDVSPSKCDMPA